MDTISFDDFLKVDIRIGTVIEVLPFPEARKPAFMIKIDFGPEIGVRKTSAQVTVRYTMDELLGRKVAAVVNFPVYLTKIQYIRPTIGRKIPA